MALSPYTVEFVKVWETLRENKQLDYLFTDEKVAITLTILSLREAAYDEAFNDCEEQDSGFAGSTTWTNNNPYRKDPHVLDIIADLQRTLR